MTRLRCLALVLLCTPAVARAQQLVESFSSSIAVGNGTTLGQCKQIVARLGGGGSITVGGNKAVLTTPAVTDGALLASAQPLPSGPFVTRVLASSMAYPVGGPVTENGVVVAALVDVAPIPNSETWWDAHNVILVYVDTDTPTSSLVYIVYFNGNNDVFSWNGTSWGQGWAAYVHAFTANPATSLQVTLSRSTTNYSIAVSSGGTLQTLASVAISSVKTAVGGLYLFSGDHRVDSDQGQLNLSQIELPRPSGCVTPPDAGPPKPDLAAPKPDLLKADLAKPDSAPRDKGVSVADAAAAPDAGPADARAGEAMAAREAGPKKTWDLAFDPRSGDGPAKGGCHCATSGAPDAATPVALLLLALTLARARRRR